MKRFIILFIALILFFPPASDAQAPLPIPTPEPQKRIDIDLSEQRLRYYFGDIMVNDILISSGLSATPTPVGTFYVQIKRPFVWYFGRNRNGSTYNYPKTKWNLQFLPHYYIHGAYWHNNFGHPMSHGCVNVSYKDMEQLYNFAKVGAQIFIHE